MEAESNLGGLLGKSSRLMSNKLNKELTKYQLTTEQWSLLALLWSKNDRTQKSLQNELLKNKSTINSLVNYLIKNGFITKKQDTKDKRNTIISLTPLGMEVQLPTIMSAQSVIMEAIMDINKDDLEITKKTLLKIIKNLKE